MGNRVAIITGAGTGVGRAAALSLASCKYAVTLTGRRQQPLEETAKLVGNGAKTLVVTGDVGKAEDVQAVFARTKAEFGRLDVLFNNAGISARGVPLEALGVDEWQAVVDVNLTGTFLCTQEAFKIMKAQNPMGGRIINNGSVSAHAPRPDSAPYTATKHAITGLTKSTSLDGRKYDIACGQIDIGNTLTEMTTGMKDGTAQADGSVRLEPTMDVDNVAQAVVYMANLPLDANVQFMTVMATKMPYIGRG